MVAAFFSGKIGIPLETLAALQQKKLDFSWIGILPFPEPCRIERHPRRRLSNQGPAMGEMKLEGLISAGDFTGYSPSNLVV